MDGQYRKHNDRTHSSSTYHKKDGTNMRAILKEEAAKEIAEALSWDEYCAMREDEGMPPHRNPQGEDTYKVRVLTLANVANLMGEDNE